MFWNLPGLGWWENVSSLVNLAQPAICCAHLLSGGPACYLLAAYLCAPKD